MGYRDEFSKYSYVQLIKIILECGYSLNRCGEEITSNPSLSTRHDIDINLDLALQMAEIEEDNGIFSTYFISIRSPFYNPFSASNINKVNKIHEHGHNIATHINNVVSRAENPLSDINILQNIFPFLNTKIVSIHCPGSLDAIKCLLDVPAIRAMYGDVISKSTVYISDSTGRWRYGHPLESEALNPNVQYYC